MSQELADALRECRNLLVAANESFALLYTCKIDMSRETWLTIKDINMSALRQADEALKNFEQTKFFSETPLQIREWLAAEHLPIDIFTTNELYESAQEILDNACAYDILGSVLFVGEDGKYYTMTVEAVLGEAFESFVKSVLQEDVDG